MCSSAAIGPIFSGAPFMNRRLFLTAGVVGAGAMGAHAQSAPPAPSGDLKPSLEFVFRATVTLGAPLEQGTYDNQRKRIVPITGGVVEGPKFKGQVLTGGADWQTLRVGDGNTQIYARYTLQHEDGTIVSVVNPGVRRGPAEVMTRLAAGEVVDPALYYFRASPQFDVRPGPHGWLMENTFVCVGKRWPKSVDLDIYRVG
jgi:hypothetical protein